MKRRMAGRQGGAALLVLLAVLAIGASWFMVSKLDALAANATARNRQYNADVLNRAKQTLIGYAIAQANKSFEDNPGALPCPEHPWYISYEDKVGQAGPSVGVSSPGSGTANCSSVGRYPWRTIGSEAFSDAAGEPLWYVVGPAWRKTSTSTKTTINSNTAGDVTVDGQQVVALIIAPGRVLTAQASTTAYGVACGARNQARVSPVTYAVDALDYLECFNAATLQFASTGPDASFNDQVVKITVDDLMPGIEAAVADRIEREIVPALNAVYAPTGWNFAGTRSIFPYAASFASPGPGTGTSPFLGVAGTYQGLLPFNQTQGCTSDATIPRCLPALIAWSGTPANAVELNGFGYIQSQTCSWASADIRDCSGEYHEYDTDPTQAIRLQMSATFSNVAMGLRAIDETMMTIEARDDTCAPTCAWETQTVTHTATMNADGSATVTFSATMPNIDAKGWGTYAQFRIRIDRAVIADHALLDTTDSTTGWFAHNEWYRLAYYAVAAGHTAAVLPTAPSCTTGSTCVTVTNVTPAGGQRALLILAGRSVNGSARPSATLADYLELGNATGAFLRQTVSAGNAITAAQRFNDRVVVLSSN
jgi:hypothetical protein